MKLRSLEAVEAIEELETIEEHEVIEEFEAIVNRGHRRSEVESTCKIVESRSSRPANPLKLRSFEAVEELEATVNQNSRRGTRGRLIHRIRVEELELSNEAVWR